MTGFGSATHSYNGGRCVVEIRSLNGKYLKVQVRLSEIYSCFERNLEELIAQFVERGSVYLTIRIFDESVNKIIINQSAFQSYVDFVKRFSDDNSALSLEALPSFLNLPGVVSENVDESHLEKVIEAVQFGTRKAVESLVEMRAKEGKCLEKNLRRHISSISEKLIGVESRASVCLGDYRKRLEVRLGNVLPKEIPSFKEEDLLREIVLVAERSDITEEVDRLRGHLSHFISKLESEQEVPIGRVLEFLSQEMLREANTMGSKSIDAQLSKDIIELKGLIDRVKEQVQNVE